MKFFLLSLCCLVLSSIQLSGAAIGNFVWNDIDANGVQSAGEPGKDGVTVELWADADSDGAIDDVIATTTSANGGIYQFDGLAAGNYRLRFLAPAGWSFTPLLQQANSVNVDSNADPASGLTAIFNIADSDTKSDIDCGIYQPCAIGNFVWDDVNADGKQDATEPGLALVRVNLSGTTNTGLVVNRTTNTDINGQYSFPLLAPGLYQVQFVSPPGYTISPKDRGSDDSRDSDADPVSGATLFESLVSGEENLHYDCGMLKPNTFIKGYVRNDQNGDCQADPGEQGLGAWLVKASQGTEVFYTFSRPDGSFCIYAPPGLYMLDAEAPLYTEGITCSPLPEVNLIDSTQSSIPIRQVKHCAVLTVDMSTPLLRRCFDSHYYVQYCNIGAKAVENAYIDITLDSFLIFQSATVPHTTLGGHSYRFPVGTILPFECRNFELTVKISCDAVLEQTHCSEAHIFPDTSCQPVNPQWTGAKVESFARCLGNTLRIVLKNTGTGAMSSELEYVIIEDGVMGKPVRSNPLTAGDSLVLNLPGNGSTWRVEAKQEPTYTGWSAPVLSVEGCTNGSSFSTGFVQQFPQNDAEPAIDIDCTANVGSYDPNDKQVLPLGYGPLRYIEPRTELKYTLRFQNTGTDTAFNVYLLDTLSPLFDFRTLRPGPSSHPYTYELIGPGILKFNFLQIRLPWQAINDAGSQGFVSYSISLRENAPLESDVFNRAGIYFDFNPPVITNTTQNRIGVNFVAVSVQPASDSRYQAIVQPNPLKYHTTILLKDAPVADQYHLKIFSATGQLIHEQDSVTPVFPLDADSMASGIYFFSIFGQNQLWSTGKVVVTRE